MENTPGAILFNGEKVAPYPSLNYGPGFIGNTFSLVYCVAQYRCALCWQHRECNRVGCISRLLLEIEVFKGVVGKIGRLFGWHKKLEIHSYLLSKSSPQSEENGEKARKDTC